MYPPELPSLPISANNADILNRNKTASTWISSIPALATAAGAIVGTSKFRPTILGILELMVGYVFVILLWTLPYSIWRSKSTPDTLRVDEQGIFFTREGSPHNYLWIELAKTKLILIDSRGPMYGVQLQRIGCIYTTNDLIDYIIPIHFGFEDSVFRSIVSAGIENWGNPIYRKEAATA
jgi:hypothetical protein